MAKIVCGFGNVSAAWDLFGKQLSSGLLVPF